MKNSKLTLLALSTFLLMSTASFANLDFGGGIQGATNNMDLRGMDSNRTNININSQVGQVGQQDFNTFSPANHTNFNFNGVSQTTIPRILGDMDIASKINKLDTTSAVQQNPLNYEFKPLEQTAIQRIEHGKVPQNIGKVELIQPGSIVNMSSNIGQDLAKTNGGVIINAQ